MLPISPTGLLPSLEVAGNDAILSLSELRRLLAILLQGIQVDEEWYLDRYPDVADEVRRGAIASAREHYVNFGYLEGRMPHRPEVDEAWYAEKYPDVAKAIKDGIYPNAFEHFVRDGYPEGRYPVPHVVWGFATFSNPPATPKTPPQAAKTAAVRKVARGRGAGRRDQESPAA